MMERTDAADLLLLVKLHQDHKT